jgi:hypothetical protein
MLLQALRFSDPVCKFSIFAPTIIRLSVEKIRVHQRSISMDNVVAQPQEDRVLTLAQFPRIAGVTVFATARGAVDQEPTSQVKV